MTERRGGSSDYDCCGARKSHTAAFCEWLRPQGLEVCIIPIPPVVKLRHSKVVVSRQQDGVLCCCCGP